MNKRIFLLLLPLTFTLFITVACSNTDEEDGAQNNKEESTQSKEDENEVNDSDNEEDESDLDDKQNDEQSSDNQTNEDNEKSSSSEDSLSASDKVLPDTIEVDEQIRHSNGVNLTLEKITFEEDHISVHFNAQNGFGDTVYLAHSGKDGVTLEDDAGEMYQYIADDDSMKIELKKQEKVTGTINFLGNIDDDAKSLTLIFNGGYGSETSQFDRNPKFVFEDIEIKR